MREGAGVTDLVERLRQDEAWTGDDGLQVELRLDAAAEIERVRQIADEAIDFLCRHEGQIQGANYIKLVGLLGRVRPPHQQDCGSKK